MIRVSELKLPLSALPVEERRAVDAPAETEEDRLPPPHPEAALRQLAAQALGITATDIATLQVFKRSFDARKAELLAVFIVDLTLTEPEREAALLAQLAQHPHIQPTPDMRWQPPVQAPSGFGARDFKAPRRNCDFRLHLAGCALLSGAVFCPLDGRPRRRYFGHGFVRDRQGLW